MKFLLKFYFFFLILFFLSLLWRGEILAQNKKIDSLQVLLKKDKLDTNKINHFNQLSIEYKNARLYDTAIDYANSALQLALKLNFKKGMAISYTKIGNVYDFLCNYPEALKCFTT